MITATDIALPVQGEFWGEPVIALPDSSSVLLTLPSRGWRAPWCVVDVETGEVRRGTNMPGDLCAVLPASDGQWWGLATFGVVRLSLDGRLVVTDVFRKGIGKYQRTMIDFDHDLLAVGNNRMSSMQLVSKADGSAVRRMKLAGPELAYPLSDGRLRVLSFHHGEATDVDVARRKVVARRPLPHGKGALHVDGQVFVLLGRRHDHRIDDPEPGARLILVVGDDSDVTLTGWDVLTHEIGVLDPETLEVRRRAPVPGECVEVLGFDSSGRVVVSMHHGFVVLDPQTLAVVDSYALPQEINGAALVGDAVCLLLHTSLHVVRLG